MVGRLSKNKPGKKLLKDLNIKVGTGPMNMDQIVKNHKELGLPTPENFESWWPPKGYKPIKI